MSQQRKGMASVESLLLIAVGAMILMGLTQYWKRELAPKIKETLAIVIGEDASPKPFSRYGSSNQGDETSSTGIGSLADLPTLTGALDPNVLTSRADREDAYQKLQDLLSKAGGIAATVKFPTLAANVTDDLAGLLANLFLYDPTTEYFLERANARLYEVNNKIFNRLISNPNELFDPTEFLENPTGDLRSEPKNGLEFDLQMVKFEQRQLEDSLDGLLPKDPEAREGVFDEINYSLKLDHEEFPRYLGTGARYIGGRIFHYESEAVRLAYGALGGRNPDFRNESDRRTIGFAAAFIEHGYTETQFYQYIASGRLPDQ